MGVTVSGRYLGAKRVELRHDESGVCLETDAPKDNRGEGATFSPTDLVGAALASCIVTIMAFSAEEKGIKEHNRVGRYAVEMKETGV